MPMFDASSSPALEVSQLRFTAHGKRLVDIPSLTLEPKGITVIMGPNGAGKSVLLRLMHGLLPPDSGEVRCFGEPISPAVARTQALVFQSPVLLRRTAEANLRFVLKARKRDLTHAKDLLETVGLADKARTPARRLSGGERQRLAISVALATAPKLLFLDEPSASLDPASALAIETIVRDAAARDVRIVFVTHDANQARRLADDVVFLANGQVVEHAPAARFFDAPETRAAQNYLAGRLIIADD